MTIGAEPVDLTASLVIGGSGNVYPTIQDGVDGETDQDFPAVTQAGTAPGIVVGDATWPAVDGALTGAYIVLTDATPGNGLAAQWARIKDYAGASRTAVLDAPWDFGVGEDVRAVFPAYVKALGAVFTEGVIISKNLILEFANAALEGPLAVTGGAFCKLIDGNVKQGITFGGGQNLLRMENMIVSAPLDSPHAFQMIFAGGVGAVECFNCEFRGVVEGRRSAVRWIIKDCVNVGLNDGVEMNVPWKLIRGGSLGNVAVSIDSMFSGAIFYAGVGEAITAGLPNFLDLQANIKPPLTAPGNTPLSPNRFAVVMVEGSGASTAVMSAGRLAISAGSLNNGTATDDPDVALDFALLRALNFTGVTADFNAGAGLSIMLDLSSFGGLGSLLTVEGASTTTGPVTLSVTSEILVNLGTGNFTPILLSAPIDSIVSVIGGAQIRTKGGRTVEGMRFNVDQTVGTPSVILAKNMDVEGAFEFNHFGFDPALADISVGTWTISADILIQGLSFLNPAGTLAFIVTGGDFTIDGICLATFLASNANGVVQVAGSNASGGTLDVSGFWRLTGGVHSEIRVAFAVQSGGSVTRAGTTVIQQMTFRSDVILLSSAAGSTVAGGGDIAFDYCTFINSLTITEESGTTTGPDELDFNYTSIFGTFLTQSGTPIWANARLSFRHSILGDLFTFVGDAFNDLQAWETLFNGSTGSPEKSISATGTRPALYRLWKSSYAASVRDLFPDVLHDYETWPVASAAARGDLMTSNTAGRTLACGASTDQVEGILLDTVPAVVDSNAILVRRGMMFVNSNAAVVAGDNCVLDTATPNIQVQSTLSVAGQRTARALQNTGTTVAGQAYSVIDLK